MVVTLKLRRPEAMTRIALMSTVISLTMTMSVLADERPNVLFCFSDDWGRYASIYRDPDRPGLNDVICDCRS